MRHWTMTSHWLEVLDWSLVSSEPALTVVIKGFTLHKEPRLIGRRTPRLFKDGGENTKRAESLAWRQKIIFYESGNVKIGNSSILFLYSAPANQQQRQMCFKTLAAPKHFYVFSLIIFVPWSFCGERNKPPENVKVKKKKKDKNPLKLKRLHQTPRHKGRISEIDEKD